MTAIKLDDFTRAYITAALWAETDDAGEPLDSKYSPDDLAPETLQKIVTDCEKFQKDNAADLAAGPSKTLRDCTSIEYAGHNFWLTRQGHGCGFWDGDWPEEAGERLTAASKKFGECYLYVGDNGKLYI
jgi:hypothetical protein